MTIIAAGICGFVVFLVWAHEVPRGPIADVYMVEILMVALLALVAQVWAGERRSRWAVVPWIGSGILAAFVVLGVRTVGGALMPAMLCLALAGVIADRRTGRRLAPHLAVWVGSAAVQGVGMWTVVLALRA